MSLAQRPAQGFCVFLGHGGELPSQNGRGERQTIATPTGSLFAVSSDAALIGAWAGSVAG
jgi:hypothetical protein